MMDLSKIPIEQIYQMLLNYCFHSQDTIDKIVSEWLDNRINESSIINKKNTRKGSKFFSILKDDIVETEHIGYAFFKKVLNLKPDLEIIISNTITVFLFENKSFGISTHNMKKFGLHIVKSIYNCRYNIFSNVSYPICQAIMYGVNRSKMRIHDNVRFNILQSFHIKFLNTMVKMHKQKIFENCLKNKMINQSLSKSRIIKEKKKVKVSEDVLYQSILMFLTYYRDGLLKLFTELMQKYEMGNYAEDIRQMLRVFIVDVKSEIDSIIKHKFS